MYQFSLVGPTLFQCISITAQTLQHLDQSLSMPSILSKKWSIISGQDNSPLPWLLQ